MKADISQNPMPPFFLSFIIIIMPKSWAKDYVTILKSRSDDWTEARGRQAKKVIVEEIIDKIREQVGEDESLPECIDDVCLLYTCQ